MSQDTESFEQLRRLLVLKRHEQPPPGYFNNFSSQVIARIRRGERGEDGLTLERLFWEAPWLQRIWQAFESRPALAGVFGVAMCGLLITGVFSSERSNVSPVALVPTMPEETVPMALANMSPASHVFLAQPALLGPAGTNPIAAVPVEESLLGDLSKLRAQPASFTFPGGN